MEGTLPLVKVIVAHHVDDDECVDETERGPTAEELVPDHEPADDLTQLGTY